LVSTFVNVFSPAVNGEGERAAFSPSSGLKIDELFQPTKRTKN